MNDIAPESAPDESGSVFDSTHRTRNRAILVGMLLLSMLPLLAAVFIYYGNPGSVAGAQTNRGALLDPPAQLEDLGLRDAGGVITAQGPRIWRLVLFAPQPCLDACIERLTMLRQVQRLLGRDADRVTRLVAFSVEPPTALTAQLALALPDMDVVRAEPGLLVDVLRGRERVGGDALEPGAPLPAEGVLVVDPLGNVIFYHGLDQIGEALLFDLKRLMRLSNIG